MALASLAWNGLSIAERDKIRESNEVTVIAANLVGQIVEAQVIDQSSPGTSGGAELGASVAGARYVDRAFEGDSWSYSASDHLRNQLVGAMLGSLLDSPAQQSFRVRYSVRDVLGNVRYFDRENSDGFRRSAGECVLLDSLDGVEALACQPSPDALRAAFSVSAPTMTEDAPHASDVEARLRVLDTLREKGTVTDEEYKQQRAKILGGI